MPCGLVLLVSLLLVSLAGAQHTQPPYPPSDVIGGISVDWSSHIRAAVGSDNFMLTWADDGHQYGIWGDGGGFVGSNSKYRVSFGVGRIEGGPDAPRFFDVYGHPETAEFAAETIGKSWGLISVDGVLYAWVHPDKPGGWGDWMWHHKEARLHASRDHGASWQPTDWAFTLEQDLAGGNILQFGKDYEGARDGYVYTYMTHPHQPSGPMGHMQTPGEVYLLRAPKDRLLERGAYEFFSGMDGDAPIWRLDVTAKKPVFRDPNGASTTIGIAFNRGLGRYLLTTEHATRSKGSLGLFEAPQPWGPWRTVHYASPSGGNWFGHDAPAEKDVPPNTFFWCFPTKWMSAGGRDAVMVFTGGGRGKNNDSFNLVKVQLLPPH